MRALITTDTVGGEWTFTEELTNQLAARGWAVRLVSLGGLPSAAQQSWCDRMKSSCGERFDFAALDAPLEWMPDNVRAWSDSASRLTDLVRDFGAHIVHANQFCFGALPVGLPIVVTSHSDVLSWARACGRVLDDSPWLRTYRRLVQEGLDGAAVVTAPTRWMANSLARDFRLRENAIVIPNGRSLRPGSTGNRRLQAVTAGRLWDEAKNVAWLAEVHLPVPLLIAGATAMGDDEPLQISGGARLLGALAPAELHALFRESAIYICSSRYEPFGLAPLEAALCGCALLLNDLPSLREIWGEAAAYFGDGAELTAWLQRFVEEPQELERARMRAQHRARQLSAERMADEYESLFRKLIAGRTAEAKPWHAVCA